MTTSQSNPSALSGHARRHTLIALVTLGLICAISITVNWLKLLSFWGDPGRGLFEAYRFAQGEMIYRDFTLQYPPLATWLIGMAFRVFGGSFITAQIVLDALCIAITFLTWSLARRVLPELVALAIAAALALQGANQYVFFTLSTYSPSQLTGMIGILLGLMGALDYWRAERLTARPAIEIALGGFVSLLSKPEFMLGVVACIGAMACIDLRREFFNRPLKDWLGRYALLGALAFLPGVLVYGVLFSVTGADNVLAGLTGYGQSAGGCFWPTGLGLFGGLAALGQGIALLGVLSVVNITELHRRFGRKYWIFGLLALGGAALFAYYYYYVRYIQSDAGLSMPLLYHVRDLTQMSTVLLPVMWFALPVWFLWTARVITALARRREINVEFGVWYVLLTTALALTARSIFGYQTSSATAVSLAAEPVLLIIAAYFLLWIQEKFFESTSPVRTNSAGKLFSVARLQSNLTWLVITAYAGVHFLGVVREGVSGGDLYTSLNTAAGPVLVSEVTGIVVYEYVVNRTHPDDWIMSVVYDGGINFAAHRPSPVFSTQFITNAPAQKFLEADLADVKEHPPRLVIAEDHSTLGAGYGWWPPSGNWIMRCPFPAFVWSATEPAYAPDTPFPVIEYIRANYRVQDKVGGKVIYVPQ